MDKKQKSTDSSTFLLSHVHTFACVLFNVKNIVFEG